MRKIFLMHFTIFLCFFSLGDKLTKKALTQSSLVDQRQILAKTREGKKYFLRNFCLPCEKNNRIARKI